MYLAVIETTEYASYAALIDVERWYADLARISTSDGVHLLLLGSREKILMHEWTDGPRVTAVEELTQDNCDLQAVRHMMESRMSGEGQTVSYPLSYPGESFVHEMRMTVIPAETSVNGYFIVGLTSDYDEIIQPVQAAAVRMILYGGMVVVGVLLLLLLAIRLVQQGRQRDQELQRLIQRNEETSKLLQKTQELAHHQRLETIGTLAASIAHEFNNLLTPIMGYSILTLEGLPEGANDLADNVTEIYEASRKAKTIISRLNELSRKSGEVHFRTLCLADLVGKALEVAAPAQPAHVSTVVRREYEDCRITGNETQLSQMLLNLILNAFQAMEDGGGVLTLTIRREGEEQLLLVEDNGKGIPEDALTHIFEPFFTTKESGKGTGLGLAIVHQVVESHHGSVSVRSVCGEGTTFTLCFPHVEENPQP